MWLYLGRRVVTTGATVSPSQCKESRMCVKAMNRSRSNGGPYACHSSAALCVSDCSIILDWFLVLHEVTESVCGCERYSRFSVSTRSAAFWSRGRLYSVPTELGTDGN